MAEVKFNKGSEEWMMFTDFWQLCQKYWKVESSDEYWDSLIDCMNDFCEKYKEIPLARKIAFALIETMEEKYKERGKIIEKYN